MAIETDAFFDLAPSHVHYARIRGGTGAVAEYLFTDAERRHTVSAEDSVEPSGEAASFGAYLRLGVEHILAGIDHLAFLAALLLLCRRLRDVVWMATGFTLGHSVTLSLAVLGVVEPDVPVIEALIGFTIALVAAENVGVTTGSSRGIAWLGGAGLALFALVALFLGVGPPARTLVGLALFTVCYLPLAGTPEAATRLRPLLTVVFGLIHGFGFASVLIEIGMPPGRLASALFGFNVGVEIGQLAVVAVLWGVGLGLARFFKPGQARLAVEVLSSGLCALGLYCSWNGVWRSRNSRWATVAFGAKACGTRRLAGRGQLGIQTSRHLGIQTSGHPDAWSANPALGRMTCKSAFPDILSPAETAE